MAPPKTATLPTRDEFNKLLRYDRKTGRLFWKKRPRRMFKGMAEQKGWNTRFAGREAFACLNKGYKRGMIFGQSIYAHQVIWRMMTGVNPPEIDHVDGNPLNNAWSNLRVAIAGINQRNAKRRRDNSSGQVGVVRRGERWIAQIGANGTTNHIGIYDTREEAIAARKGAEIEYGFDPKHGRIA
jgi:HNH endonuclease